jgi:hypothetical protein
MTTGTALFLFREDLKDSHKHEDFDIIDFTMFQTPLNFITNAAIIVFSSHEKEGYKTRILKNRY